MATNRALQSRYWLVNIESGFPFSEEEREIIVQLFNEVAWRSRKLGSTILHDVFEEEKVCQLVVETNKAAFNNLIEVFRDNLHHSVSIDKIS